MGFPRYTADLEILIRAADLAVTGKLVQVGFKPNRIDVVTSISGVSFDEIGATPANSANVACRKPGDPVHCRRTGRGYLGTAVGGNQYASSQ